MRRTRSVPIKANESSEQRAARLEYLRAWRARNPDAHKTWVLENSEAARAIAARCYEKNKDRINRLNREKYAADPTAINQKNKAWRIANPDYVDRRRARSIEWARTWVRNNPEEARALNLRKAHRRRARLNGSSDNYTAEELANLRAKAGGKCALCNAHRTLTVDHIVPLSRGGSNGIRNIQFLCRRCNSSKGARDPIEFSQAQGLLV
jgi:5-methylcytosine-specific restriction endonuclease McrA